MTDRLDNRTLHRLAGGQGYGIRRVPGGWAVTDPCGRRITEPKPRKDARLDLKVLQASAKAVLGGEQPADHPALAKVRPLPSAEAGVVVPYRRAFTRVLTPGSTRTVLLTEDNVVLEVDP